MANNNAIEKGLQAAKQAAREEGMAGKVEELSNNLQANAGAGMNADATDAAAVTNIAQGGDAGMRAGGGDTVADAAARAAIAPDAEAFRNNFQDDANL